MLLEGVLAIIALIGVAGTYMSQYKSQEKVWSKKLDKLYEAFGG